MQSWRMSALLVATLAANAALAVSANDRVVSRPQFDIRTFCGADGHEPSLTYSEAVLAEIKRREALGAKSAAEALRGMALDYCGAVRNKS